MTRKLYILVDPIQMSSLEWVLRLGAEHSRDFRVDGLETSQSSPNHTFTCNNVFKPHWQTETSPPATTRWFKTKSLVSVARKLFGNGVPFTALGGEVPNSICRESDILHFGWHSIPIYCIWLYIRDRRHMPFISSHPVAVPHTPVARSDDPHHRGVNTFQSDR